MAAKSLFVVFLAIGVIGCSKKQNTQQILDLTKSNLLQATNIHEYEDIYVNDRAEELKEIYAETPHDVCNTLGSMESNELIDYREILEETQEIPCVRDAVAQIDGYYDQYMAQNHTYSFKKQQSTLASTVEVLNTPLSMPNQKQLPSKVLNLTFDDGPHPTNTEKLLDILDGYGVKANFFVVGRNVKAYPHLVEEVADHGHSVGGHSMTHADLAAKGFSKATAEISGVLELIQSVLGGYDPYFRFPYGSRTKALRNYLVQSNVADFFWSVNTLDWKYKNPDYLLKYAIDQTVRTGRGVVLFHDIQPQTIAIMPQYLKYLEQAGFKTVVYYPQAK